MYMVWHVDKYKITFKLIISFWTNEISFSTHSGILFSSEYFHYKIFIHEECLENYNDSFQENLSCPGIIDARTRYRAAAWRLRNTVVEHTDMKHFQITQQKSEAWLCKLHHNIINLTSFVSLVTNLEVLILYRSLKLLVMSLFTKVIFFLKIAFKLFIVSMITCQLCGR